jgi:predicted DNA-binding protein
MKKPRKVVTYVRLSESSIKQLDQLAQQEETDRAAIIRRIVINALRDGETSFLSVQPTENS